MKSRFAELIPAWQKRLDAARDEIAEARKNAEARVKIAREAIALIEKQMSEADPSQTDVAQISAGLNQWQGRLEEALIVSEGPDHAYMTAERKLEAAKGREVLTQKGSRPKLDHLQANSIGSTPSRNSRTNPAPARLGRRLARLGLSLPR